MTDQVFDSYKTSYEQVVAQSVAFSGLKHDFFLAAKIIQLKALFARHFGSCPPSLLDVGCGVGRMHPLLAPLIGRLAGADVSTASLDRARRDNPQVDYRAGTGTALPWADASFDATLAVCVLHHVASLERASLIAEMKRVTKPGGLVIAIEHNPFNPLTRLAVARCPFDADALLLRAEETRERLAAAGLRDIACRHFLMLPSLSGAAARMEALFAGLPLGAQYIASGTA